MHGLGNDFILINCLSPTAAPDLSLDWAQMAPKLCDRHLGIGADGLILLLPSQTADLKMRIFNADGSEAEMCGNGIRCCAKFAFENSLIKKPSLTVETLAGIIKPQLIITAGLVSEVKVDMGKPIFTRNRIPVLGEGTQVVNEALKVQEMTFRITSILMGVPHTIIYVDNLAAIDVATLGPAVETHPLFPQKTNVNFVQIINKQKIRVRTWERGAGLTLACGTGSCAAVVASALNQQTERQVLVELAKGNLLIQWAANDIVYMTGPATTVYQGQWLL